MKKSLFLAAASLLIASCAGGYYYDFSLLDVQRPDNAVRKYGPVSITRVRDTSATRYRFSDSCVDVVVCITGNQFEFSLTNKTQGSIKILWDKAAYVNASGSRKRVIHRGTNFMQKELAQSPTVVFGGETVKDFLLPSENVNVYLYGSGGWTIYPLLSRNDVGRNVRMVLPLEIGGVVVDYVFTCKILGV